MDRFRVSSPPTFPSDSDPTDAASAQGAAPRPDALKAGTRLEEFQIERVIGSSSFGIVYLANDEAFERRVAIKEYLPDTLAVRSEDNEQVLLRAASHADAFEHGRRAFIEEAQLLARCDHPSLLHVLRSWETNGTVYRAMPYYAGHSLLSLRQAMHVPPDEASLRALLDGLLDALQTLHDAGTLHREVSPRNIMLLHDDRPLLLDFSAPRRAIVGDEARALMTLLGPSFAALEQTAPSPERPLGPWTDVYAVAAVIRYCITGKLPPPASLYAMPRHEPMPVLVRRLQEHFPLVHYSPSFLAAIERALAPTPQDRPRDVVEFRRLLNDPVHAAERRIEPLFTESGEIPFADEPTLGPFPVEPPQEASVEVESTAAPAETPELDEEQEPLDEPTASFTAWSTDVAGVPADEVGPVAAAEAPSGEPAAAPVPARPVEAASPPPAEAASPPRVEAASPPAMAPRDATPPRHAAPKPQLYAPERTMPVFNHAAHARRHRRRVGLSATLLVLLAAAGGAWMIDQHRDSIGEQSAFADAARQDGLTANVPAIPKSPDDKAAAATPAATTVAATAPAPVVVAALPEAPTAATTSPEPPSNAGTTSTSGTEAAAPVVTASAEPVEEEIEAAPPARSKSTASARKTSAVRSSAVASHAARSTTPSRSAAKPAAAERSTTSPRDACGNRTQFSLYRCMQTQCAQSQWAQHPLCKRLRIRDEVD